MKRIHAIEFEDFAWFPEILRNCMTDFYQFQMITFNLYKPAALLLSQLLRQTGKAQIFDLCSGGSGPWLTLKSNIENELDAIVGVTLTDKFPNIPSFTHAQNISDGKIHFEPLSVDATNIPTEFNGVRTLFSSFHHFRPELARLILEDAIDKQQPIAVFELSNRSFLSFVNVILMGPLSYFLLAPFFKPRSAVRFLFTYLIPVLPLLCLWDGVASNLRAYSVSELHEVIKSAKGSEKYEWNVGTAKGSVPGAYVTYMTGRVKTA